MKKIVLVVGLVASSATFSAPVSNQYWHDVQPLSQLRQLQKRSLSTQSTSDKLDLKSRHLRLDVAALKEKLFAKEGLSKRPGYSFVKTELPLPNGKFVQVKLSEYQLLSAEMQAQHPEYKAWKVEGVSNNGITGRVDFTSAGFHGMLVMPDGETVYIDPEKNASTNYYQSFNKRDNRSHFKTDFNCSVHDEHTLFSKANHLDEPSQNGIKLSAKKLAQQPALNLITYRLALAGTAEYTASQGGTKASAYDSMFTTINRVNEIYQRDLGIALQLVSGESLIYTDAQNDPYTSGNASSLVSENITNVNNHYGADNYDIGHVFDASQIGGLAYVGATCFDQYKAGGATGTGNPNGETFSIEYVAHEMGHQFGASHTFNSTKNACSGANRTPETAVEPGSGSSIMSYSGLCGSDNLQWGSDATFHYKSITQINSYTRTANGNSCGVSSASGNQAPTADAGLNGYIPAKTPFLLKAGDTISGSSFSWDQIDAGAASAVDVDMGNNAIIRQLLPVASTDRYIPRLTDLFNGTTTLGEILPQSSRDLNFALVARGGGIGTDMKKISVKDTGQSFKVLSQTGAETYATGQSVDIYWNVAGTNNSPINCSSVDINLLQITGEKNELLLNTVNDGTQQIIIPAATPLLSGARIMVACSNQPFFQISSGSITIEQGTGDLVAPVITIIGAVSPSITQGSNYTDLGATAVDDVDGSITVKTTGSVDTNTPGNYQISYSATDLAGNSATAIRNVTVTPVADTQAPVITLNGAPIINLTVGDNYVDAGATAVDNVDSIVSVTSTNNVNTAVAGDYSVVYHASDIAGNSSSETRLVKVKSVILPDTVAPVITLRGEPTINLFIGDSYIEQGATALDDRDGALAVTTTGVVDTSKVGAYTISYSAMDQANNSVSVQRMITVTAAPVVDTTAPVVTLSGSTTININVGDRYTEPGFTGVDAVDGELLVTVTGNIDTSKAGTYIVTYTSTDAAGNSTSKTRTVIVKAVSVVEPETPAVPDPVVTVTPPVVIVPNDLTADSTAPEITLTGATTLKLKVGDDYADPGFAGFDNKDGKLVVTVKGDVDMSKAGTYIVTYTATDAAGNTITKRRTIVVSEISTSSGDKKKESSASGGSANYLFLLTLLFIAGSRRRKLFK